MLMYFRCTLKGGGGSLVISFTGCAVNHHISTPDGFLLSRRQEVLNRIVIIKGYDKSMQGKRKT
ncbi:MAG TPA: hypothetical protein VLH18_05915, partial [Candidatus Limnocylindrales bacterium]|nr:hypothetical protein [Candidatus Limnocylindrales bacterium]